MYLVKGFGINSSTAINTPGVINFFGEISTQSLTYTKEKGIYKNPNIYGVTFLSFLCEKDGVKVQLPDSHSHHVVAVCSFVFNKIMNTRNAGYLLSQLLQELAQEFVGAGNDFKGGLIESEDGYYCPDWIEWKSVADGSSFKIWFIDRIFQNQYDEYILEFAPPFDNLDTFFAGGVAVEQMLTSVTPNDIVDKIQTIKGVNPETFIRLESYNYHDPFNVTRRVLSHWGVLGYGIAANNIDVIKERLIDFILANSTHTRQEWAEILPDLFKRTEFVIVPLWNQYAIEPRTTTPGIFSPIARPNDINQLLKEILPPYTPYQIDQYATIMGFPFKSLAVAAIGNADNRDAKFLLSDYFPDFINVSSTSLDFNRMQERTKLWSLSMHELITWAENTTPSTSVPLTISKLERDGILYLSRMFDNIQYLVATRYSIENL